MALAATSYHWSLHAWAIYAIVALALALFSYNKGLPLSIRSAFYPILGDRVWGWWGHTIDTLLDGGAAGSGEGLGHRA